MSAESFVEARAETPFVVYDTVLLRVLVFPHLSVTARAKCRYDAEFRCRCNVCLFAVVALAWTARSCMNKVYFFTSTVNLYRRVANPWGFCCCLSDGIGEEGLYMHGHGMAFTSIPDICVYVSFKTRGRRAHYSYIIARSRRRADTRPLFLNRNAVPVHQRGMMMIGICAGE